MAATVWICGAICLSLVILVFFYEKFDFIDKIGNILFDFDTGAGDFTTIIFICSSIMWAIIGIYWLMGKDNLKYDTREECIAAKRIECQKEGVDFNEGSIVFLTQRDRNNYKKGKEIGIVIIGITVLVVTTAMFKDKYDRRYDRQLQSINSAMQICARSDDETMKELYNILLESKKKIMLQMNFLEVKDGIDTIKKIQKRNKNIDIQTEIDKLNALQKLDSNSDINKLIRKYQRYAKK